jgi:hypothetical protein
MGTKQPGLKADNKVNVWTVISICLNGIAHSFHRDTFASTLYAHEIADKEK